MKYTTLLFDLDDTLMDFKKAEENAIEKLLLKYSLPATEENKRLYSLTNQSKWKALERGEITRKELFATRFPIFLKLSVLRLTEQRPMRIICISFRKAGLLLTVLRISAVNSEEAIQCTSSQTVRKSFSRAGLRIYRLCSILTVFLFPKKWALINRKRNTLTMFF